VFFKKKILKTICLLVKIFMLVFVIFGMSDEKPSHKIQELQWELSLLENQVKSKRSRSEELAAYHAECETQTYNITRLLKFQERRSKETLQKKISLHQRHDDLLQTLKKEVSAQEDLKLRLANQFERVCATATEERTKYSLIEKEIANLQAQFKELQMLFESEQSAQESTWNQIQSDLDKMRTDAKQVTDKL